MSKSDLLLNGSPLSFERHSPTLKRLMEHLDTMPDNEVFDARSILEMGIAGRDLLMRAARINKSFFPYRTLIKSQVGHSSYVFAKPSVIKKVEAEFKKAAKR